MIRAVAPLCCNTYSLQIVPLRPVASGSSCRPANHRSSSSAEAILAAPRSVTRSRASLNSESQRQSKGGRFQRIVYPGAETSADVSPAAVAVDGRQDPDRIDEQDARCGEVALRSQLRVAQRRAGNTLAELFDPCGIDFVRRDDEFHVRIPFDQSH